MLSHRETDLHTALLKARYEELKVLTGWIQRMHQIDAASIETDVINRKYLYGNTVLHVAAYCDTHPQLSGGQRVICDASSYHNMILISLSLGTINHQ
ncbi:unnamed protein product [Eruca vesicaria subsp. sativa]|uniref:Uncharacterized protein n=1 Tax=Eruca vesicaria subsp. sativa TaxID=29727 RepID=A0ABC8KMT9_ERUVS|nr:unnamed protein product [Eruca vesicaria subsp. sativa]